MKQFLHQIQEVLGITFATLSAFFAPVAGTLLAVGAAIFLDVVVAYWRTRVKKESWTSRKMGKGLIGKFLSYQTAVILFFFMDKFILNDFVFMFANIPFLMTKVIALVIIFIELKSIDESWKIVKGVGLFEGITKLIKFSKKIKNQIEDINENKKELEK